MEVTKNKDTESIPLHRVSLLAPFTGLLKDVGAPIESLFSKAKLPWFALDDDNNYVPSRNFYRFVLNSAHSEGIPDLGFRAGIKFGANTADPAMTALLRKAPTLYRGLRKANARVNSTVTHCHFGLKLSPSRDYTYFYHSPSCGADNPATEQIGWFGITALVGMVRVYTGLNWQPAEIGLMTDTIPSHYIREKFPNSRIRQSQPASYITVEDAALSLPPLFDGAAVPVSSSLDYRHLPIDFVSSLERTLESYVQEDNLSIDLTAQLCSTSKRSLQRKLKESGTSYNELLSHARFRVASQMLQNLDLSATAVAYHLGYSNETHFARAFRRIAGVSPRVYRQQFIH
jgi:AraC-like DNA-binding protein